MKKVNEIFVGVKEKNEERELIEFYEDEKSKSNYISTRLATLDEINGFELCGRVGEQLRVKEGVCILHEVFLFHDEDFGTDECKYEWILKEAA